MPSSSRSTTRTIKGRYAETPLSLQDVRSFHEFNIERVENFVRIYRSDRGKGSGRKSELASDILRAAIVFLYASLEELIRQVCFVSAASLNEEFLGKIGFSTEENSRDGVREKVDLLYVMRFYDNSVEAFVRRMIGDYLVRQSFTNPGSLYAFLERAGMPLQESDKTQLHDDLREFMKRRHEIVHNVDLCVYTGRGKQRTETIGVKKVDKWIRTVERLCTSILQAATDLNMSASTVKISRL